MTDPSPHRGAPPAEPSLGELVGRMQEQTTRLIRDEMRLAQREMAEKGKRAGIGIGLFGGAGAFAVYGLGVLIAAAVLGLATVLHAWLAALIIGAALLVVAGVAALAGKKEVSQATPPVPTEAVRSVAEDIHAVRPGTPA